MIAPGLTLDTLLAALRAEGLSVGVDEVLRLQVVLQRLDGEADWAQLQHLVTAVVAKRREDRQRIAQVFERWAAEATLALPREAPDTPVGPRPLSDPPPTPPTRWRPVAVAVALSTLVAVALSVLPGPPTADRPDVGLSDAGLSSAGLTDAGLADAGLADAGLADAGLADAGPPTPLTPASIRAWVPHLVTPTSPWRAAAPPAGLTLVAAAAALWIWRRRHRRRYPEPLTPTQLDGPTHVLLKDAGPVTLSLLDQEAQEHLIWGVGHHVTDELTRHLDLPRTVARTARAGGEPDLVYQPLRRHNRVWIWLDTSTEDPAASRLAQELARALTTSGLEHTVAYYSGSPALLEDPTTGLVSPGDLEEGTAGALVLILTDGRELGYLFERTASRLAARAVFRELSHWPHVAVVDFGRGRVARLLADLELRILTPDQAPTFAQEDAPRPSPREDADLAAWMAASALAFLPQDDATLLALRRALRLKVSAWHLGTVRDAAETGTRPMVDWPLDPRVRALGWLVDAEDPTARDGLLRRAAAFWQDRFQKEAATRKSASPGFAKSRADAKLTLAQAWLGLYTPEPHPKRGATPPAAAIETLYRLHEGGLTEDIRPVAQRLRPADLYTGEPGTARLPWRLEDCDGELQLWLDELGFVPEGRVDAEALEPPGRLWLGMGLAAGLALGALVATIAAGLNPPAPERTPAPPGARVGLARRSVTDLSTVGLSPDGEVRHMVREVEVLVASSSLAMAAFPRDTSRDLLTWVQEDLPCIEDLPDGRGQLVRCGAWGTRTATQPVARTDHRAFAVVEAGEGAQAQAIGLVTRGCAAWVWVTADPAQAWVELPFLAEAPARQDQVLIFAQKPWSDAQIRALEASARDVALHVDGTLRYKRGTPSCPSSDEPHRTSVTSVLQDARPRAAVVQDAGPMAVVPQDAAPADAARSEASTNARIIDHTGAADVGPLAILPEALSSMDACLAATDALHVSSGTVSNWRLLSPIELQQWAAYPAYSNTTLDPVSGVMNRAATSAIMTYFWSTGVEVTLTDGRTTTRTWDFVAPGIGQYTVSEDGGPAIFSRPRIPPISKANLGAWAPVHVAMPLSQHPCSGLRFSRDSFGCSGNIADFIEIDTQGILRIIDPTFLLSVTPGTFCYAVTADWGSVSSPIYLDSAVYTIVVVP